MQHHRETPPLTGSIVRNGGSAISKGVEAGNYLIPDFNAKGFAPLIIAARFRLPLPLAHVVCELAGIGGRHHG